MTLHYSALRRFTAAGLALIVWTTPQLARGEGPAAVITSTTAPVFQTPLERALWESSVRFQARAKKAETRLTGEQEKVRVLTGSIAIALLTCPDLQQDGFEAPTLFETDSFWPLVGVGAGSALLGIVLGVLLTK